ncbi:MAG: hypothetical protein ACRERU_00015 [Methylococcales bacterium]
MGKVDNCPVGVFAALGRRAPASPIDARLYLPDDRANDSERSSANSGLRHTTNRSPG